eukprot:gnl/TRDRNA2_/TRDRNA2_124856_c1_seq1.p1 gnl/TRDRNA2_/TRDRNA2_124856_c1~~gnl/TRDRNA2_/TRDRNA2_124856_c1_seq1.p1  ORF type:complete len:134 (+),score=31.87 gnl/TRDRNA2_/TRDRNA2_124856_c1_seq1:3-404(+)
MSMAGFMPKPDSFTVSGSEDVPVLMMHGEADTLVKLEWAKKTQELLKSKGCTATELKTYPGLPHGINLEILEEMQQFLLRVLPNDPSKRVQLSGKLVSNASLLSFFVSCGLMLAVLRLHRCAPPLHEKPLMAT